MMCRGILGDGGSGSPSLVLSLPLFPPLYLSVLGSLLGLPPLPFQDSDVVLLLFQPYRHICYKSFDFSLPRRPLLHLYFGLHLPLFLVKCLGFSFSFRPFFHYEVLGS